MLFRIPASSPFPGIAVALLQGALCACLGTAPAYATIILAGKSAEEDATLKARAHAQGQKQKAVAQLTFRHLSRASPYPTTASGVFIGVAKDGRTGLILTSAHSWFHTTPPEQPGKLGVVMISFGPEAINSDEQTLDVAGTRLNFHPDYRSIKDDARSYSAAELMASLGVPDKPDLAILEFPMAPDTTRAMERLGIQPARLYDGNGYKKPLLDGEIVGFGRFGTSNSPGLQNLGEGRVYSGFTKVSYCTHRYRKAFYHWSPFSAEGLKLLEAPDRSQARNGAQFVLAPEAEDYKDPNSHEVYRIQSHPRQALFVCGDSGGPLLFNTSKGLAVAGIASCQGSSDLISVKDGQPRKFITQMWEPVKEHLPWITAVQSGDRSSSLVWELGLDLAARGDSSSSSTSTR